MEKKVIYAVDVGYGQVKALGEDGRRRVEFPSLIGNFQPVKYSTGMESAAGLDRLCVQYAGKNYFLGEAARRQSTPRATMEPGRFASEEGLALLIAALALVAQNEDEEVRLITGLPVSYYQGQKEAYRRALIRKHSIRLLQPSGELEAEYCVRITDALIMPQPMGSYFAAILSDNGQLKNTEIAIQNVGILDIGQYTVDMATVNKLEYVDKTSLSYNDIGLFQAFQELAGLLSRKYGVNVSPNEIDAYIRDGFLRVSGRQYRLQEDKYEIFTAAAEQIYSRAINTWRDIWKLDKILITGGGSVVLEDYLMQAFKQHRQAEVCEDATFSNCVGFHRYGVRFWS